MHVPAHGHMPGPDLDGVDPLSASVLTAWRQTMHLNRQLLMRLMGERGGHPGQAGCLRVISAHDGISQRDLADTLHLSRPTVTAMLQRMEADGLVQRWDDEHDQRLTRIRLTESGRAVAEGLRSAWDGYIDATVGRLVDDDKRELLRLLGLLNDGAGEALKQLGEQPAPERPHPGQGLHGGHTREGELPR